MKTYCLLTVLICSIPAMVIANGTTRKLWVFEEIKKDGDYGSHHFSIRNRQVENLEEIEVVIDAKDRPISPFTSSDLSLHVGGALVATLPIAEHRTSDKVVYKFRVAYAALDQSSLTIDEGAFTAGPEGEAFHAASGEVNGKPVRQIMGGTRYQLNLANLVPVHAVYVPTPRQ